MNITGSMQSLVVTAFLIVILVCIVSKVAKVTAIILKILVLALLVNLIVGCIYPDKAVNLGKVLDIVKQTEIGQSVSDSKYVSQITPIVKAVGKDTSAMMAIVKTGTFEGTEVYLDDLKSQLENAKKLKPDSKRLEDLNNRICTRISNTIDNFSSAKETNSIVTASTSLDGVEDSLTTIISGLNN